MVRNIQIKTLQKIVAKQNEKLMLKKHGVRIDEKRGKGKQTDIIKT